MKVAIVCSGIGRVQRGFERFFLNLYENLEPDCDITLFKGGGPSSERERVIWNTPRHGRFLRVVPLPALTGKTPYFYECATFALGMWPQLLRGRYDIVHYIDIYVGKVLDRLRRLCRSPVQLLYSQGVVIDPAFYPAADHIHQVAQDLHDLALEAGLPKQGMTMIPCGVHADDFVPRASRAELRKRYGIPEEQFVVLSVGAINREQKRMDHVFREVAQLGDDSLLWVDGHPEDPTLPPEGRALLGERFKLTRVETEEVRDLYALADVFVAGSLQESFGLAIVEAMCAGLPVLVHNAKHFRWLVGDERCQIDLEQQGALTAAIAGLRADPGLRRSLGQDLAASARARFDWAAITPQYLDLYQHMMAQPPATPRKASA